MNIFDYLCENGYYKDEYGNAYFASNYSYSLLERLPEMVDSGDGTYFLAKEDFDKYAIYEIKIANLEEQTLRSLTYTRRPYYRMRGHSVTEIQAFEIIRRTDNFFEYIFGMGEIPKDKTFIPSLNFNNWLIMKNHYPKGYGWIHVDGTIGCNAITGKYPTIEEFCEEWFLNLQAFPYLNLMIAVTDWDENPWSLEEKFEDAVLLGIYVHDKCIEILNSHDTLVKYQEYDEKYGQNPERFESEYYEENKITQVDETYLRRCIEAYGLNPDEELKKVSSYVWRGK